jgi:hypothetical protein
MLGQAAAVKPRRAGNRTEGRTSTAEHSEGWASSRKRVVGMISYDLLRGRRSTSGGLGHGEPFGSRVPDDGGPRLDKPFGRDALQTAINRHAGARAAASPDATL